VRTIMLAAIRARSPPGCSARQQVAEQDSPRRDGDLDRHGDAEPARSRREPMLTGLLADLYDLPTALALMPLPCVAAIAFWYGSGN
jgi:hypothetical protein